MADLCFSRQAAEKAIKALMTARGIEFLYVHDLQHLLSLAEYVEAVELTEAVVWSAEGAV